MRVSPLADVPVARLFMNAGMPVATENDLFAICNCRTNRNHDLTGPLVKTLARVEELKVIYKENSTSDYDRRPTRDVPLCEIVRVFGHRGLAVQGLWPLEARLHYTLTSTGTDCIVMAELPDNSGPSVAHGRAASCQVSKSVKVAILGEAALIPKEKEAHPDTLVTFLHHEKKREVLCICEYM